MPESPELPVAGVRPLEHTADVGLEVEARDPAELFLRAALGLGWLLTESPVPAPSEERPLSLSAPDRPGLLRAWLRALLQWQEEDAFQAADARFTRLEEDRLEAVVRGGPPPGAPIREIKGVTLHGLAAEERDGGWYGRVIFDV